MKLDKLYESKVMQGLQKFGSKLSANKVIRAVSAGLMGVVGILMIGAVFSIVTVIMDTIVTLAKLETGAGYATIKQILLVPNTMTQGLLSVFVVILVAYNYAKSLGLKPIQTAVSSLVVYLTIACVVVTVEGKSYIDYGYLGAYGLFVAMAVAILTVLMHNLCEKKNIKIRLPDSVPPFLADSFSAIIPIFFNLVIWHGVNSAIVAVTGGQMHISLLINYILSIPFSAIANTYVGIFILMIFALLFWTLGVHGTMVAGIAVMPYIIQMYTTNFTAVYMGETLTFSKYFQPVALFGAISICGGTGNTLPLIVMGLFSKSKQLNAVSKAALVPGLCNINEPVIFGFPIMYNPVLAIPFILNVPLTSLAFLGLYACGFFQLAKYSVLTTLPIFLASFATTLAWQNLLMPVVAFIIAGLCYLPFFRVYEKQLLEKEAAAAVEESTTTEATVA